MLKDQKMTSAEKISIVFERILPEILALTAPERSMLFRKLKKLFVIRL